MNRRQRRALARDVAKRQGLRGRKKQEIARTVAKQLPGGSLEPQGQQIQESSRLGRLKPGLRRRDSGLVVPE